MIYVCVCVVTKTMYCMCVYYCLAFLFYDVCLSLSLLPPLSLHSFYSIEKITRVTSPVLVIHGTDDEVIDFTHGLALFERAPRTVEPLWVEGAGHNDVELYGQYLDRLRKFIQVDIRSS